MRLSLVGLCVCASVLLTGAARAQEKSHFAATLGYGAGSATMLCHACGDAGRMHGTTYSLQLTASPQPHVRVGAMMDCWTRARDNWERDLCSLSIVGLYYPGTLRRGFFVGGGPSYGVVLASVTDTTALQRHGWGFITEMGYELLPRSTFSLTPYLQYWYGRVGDIVYPKGSGIPWARDWRHAVVSVGVGLTYHAGVK